MSIAGRQYSVLEWSRDRVAQPLEEIYDWNSWRLGMGEEGYLHTNGVDLTGPKARLRPHITTIAVASIPATGGRTIPFWEGNESATKRHYVYCAVRHSATVQRIYKIDTATDVVDESRTLTMAAQDDEVPQNAAFVQGTWYKATHVSPGHVNGLERLATIADPPATDSWTAHDTAVSNGINWILATESSDGIFQLMRYDHGDSNVISRIRINISSFLAEASWKGNFDIGASAAICNGMVNAPTPVIARRDNIYVFDRFGNSRPLIDNLGVAVPMRPQIQG